MSLRLFQSFATETIYVSVNFKTTPNNNHFLARSYSFIFHSFIFNPCNDITLKYYNCIINFDEYK